MQQDTPPTGRFLHRIARRRCFSTAVGTVRDCSPFVWPNNYCRRVWWILMDWRFPLVENSPEFKRRFKSKRWAILNRSKSTPCWTSNRGSDFGKRMKVPPLWQETPWKSRHRCDIPENYVSRTSVARIWHFHSPY